MDKLCDRVGHRSTPCLTDHRRLRELSLTDRLLPLVNLVHEMKHVTARISGIVYIACFIHAISYGVLNMMIRAVKRKEVRFSSVVE